MSNRFFEPAVLRAGATYPFRPLSSGRAINIPEESRRLLPSSCHDGCKKLALPAAQARALGHDLAGVQNRDPGRPPGAHRASSPPSGRAPGNACSRTAHGSPGTPCSAASRTTRKEPRGAGAEMRAPPRRTRRAAALVPRERTGVERVDEPSDLRVELLERHEALLRERREYPRLADIHGLLGGRLIKGPAHPRGHDRAAVVLRYLEIGAVDLHRLRLPPVVGGRRAVIGHEDVRYASGRLEGVRMGGDPGTGPHVGKALGVYPSGPRETGHVSICPAEHHRLSRFSTGSIANRHRPRHGSAPRPAPVREL